MERSSALVVSPDRNTGAGWRGENGGMRALTYDSFRGPMVVSQVPEPSAPPGGVVVAVEATGLCRSDWHGWMGHDADIVGFPHVPGHELAGERAVVEHTLTTRHPWTMDP